MMGKTWKEELVRKEASEEIEGSYREPANVQMRKENGRRTEKNKRSKMAPSSGRGL